MFLATCDFCAKVKDFVKSDYSVGFVAGVITLFVLWLIAKIISACSSKNRALVFDDGEQGTFTMSIKALSDFVEKNIAKYNMLETQKIKFCKTNEGIALNISLKAKYGLDVNAIRDKLRNDLFSEMKAKLGIIDQIGKINIQIAEFVDEEK